MLASASPAASPARARIAGRVHIKRIDHSAARIVSLSPKPVAASDRDFIPYLTALKTGTVATFPEPRSHRVYSFSPAKSFEIKLYSGRSPSSIAFDKPGVVTLGCNIHDWMIGYVLVVSTPHFAKTDAAGSESAAFTLDGIPRKAKYKPPLDRLKY